MKIDFESPKNREKALNDFQDLIKHPGWQLVQTIALENIEVIKNQIIEGLGDETVESIAMLRFKLKAYKDVINTPEFWIERLKPVVESYEDEDDPYETVLVDKKSKL